MEETIPLDGDKKKRILRNMADDDPNPNGKHNDDVGPNVDGMDQHGSTPS